MCGIVGIMGDGPVASRLIDGLKRLEYRGYDSAGIATLDHGVIERRRATGKIYNLAKHINDEPAGGTLGIGHTRWATHGVVNAQNTHPHASHSLVLVHNGIIENCHDLKEKLIGHGYIFETQTDSEVIAHLIDTHLKQTNCPKTATQRAVQELKGTYALLILFQNFPEMLIGVRQGSPLVLGIDERELFFGSDAMSIAPWTQNVIYLEDGDLAIGHKNETEARFEIYDLDGHLVSRAVQISHLSVESLSKGHYSHFMLKEIFEQPQAIIDTLTALVTCNAEETTFHTHLDFKNTQHILILACGTSYYAGLSAKYWFERIARIPVSVEIASEFRYREPVLPAHTLVIAISQSGETIDTLEALKLAQTMTPDLLAIVNVSESSIARLATHVLCTSAGPEIGVASTKAYTAQLAVLSVLALQAAHDKKTLSETEIHTYIHELQHLPRLMNDILARHGDFQNASQLLYQAQSVLYLGRGLQYPAALEGALKLKELSYIHAEGYPAGELKHGPIALIDQQTPVVVLVPHDMWYEKTLSNIEQVLLRGAHVLCITDEIGSRKLKLLSVRYPVSILECPPSGFFSSPMLYALPIQLLAYYTALQKGTDVDQPRNLAKSVTVE